MSLLANKPAPQRSTIDRAFSVLLAYGHFKWSRADGFEIGAHESARFKVFLDQATREGKITTGTWRKRTWIGFAVLSRLVSSFLSRTITQGTYNWDIPIAKCLSIVLVAALGAGSGDVARSKLYKGQEYLQYHHIELHIVGSQPTLDNVRATITLEFRKGFKIADNEAMQYYFSPLEDPQQNHMCPIAWLLVHALRHSLVVGTTLQDVLDRAFARSDRQVEWLYPTRPVLAAFNRQKTWSVDLDKPAPTKQQIM